MTHYRMSDQDPSAVIMAKNPRTGSLEELKIYQGNIVYLKDKQEFQIRLFNPTHEKLGIQINLNGKINDQVLVLNPGQDYTIDRFLNEQKKMLFETYTIDGENSTAKKAIEFNGLIEINFFKEKEHQITFTNTSTFVNYNDTQFGDNITYTNDTSYKFSKRCFCSEKDFSIDSTLTGNSLGDLSIDGDIVIDGNLIINGDTSNTNSQKLSKRKRIKKSDSSKSKKVETGRVEKGKTSTQNFEQVEVEFDTTPILSLNYKLKPINTKTYEIKEIRNYCGDCGYRIRKQSWMYCPKCGEDL